MEWHKNCYYCLQNKQWQTDFDKKKGVNDMKRILREPIVLVTVTLCFVLWGCSHAKKETVERTSIADDEFEVVEVAEDELEELPLETMGNLSNIYFDFDSSVLKKNAIMELKKIGSWLLKNPDTRIRIEGNCDERGATEYNLVLGERRAVAARNYLVNLGVPPKSIITISFGEENPADPEHNEVAWAKNRRDEFIIVD